MFLSTSLRTIQHTASVDIVDVVIFLKKLRKSCDSGFNGLKSTFSSLCVTAMI